MSVNIDPIQRTGVPATSGVYAIRYKGRPLTQLMAYFDGTSWGHAGETYEEAMQGIRSGQRLPFYKRCWWKTVATWQTVHQVKVDLVDVLKKEMNQ